MKTIKLEISGRPSTKQRPRFNSYTKKAYTPPSNIISENDIRAVWREAGEPRIEGDPAIGLDFVVYLVRPKNHYNSKGELNKKGLENPIPKKKPDADNILKTLMDSLNTRAYKDDVQISRFSGCRDWGDWPKVVVTIYPLYYIKDGRY